MKKLHLLMTIVTITTTIITHTMHQPTLYSVLDPLVQDQRYVDWDQVFTILDNMRGTISVNAYRQPESQMSLLDIAVETKNLLAAKKLLEKYNADPNAANPRIGQTPLIYAIGTQDLTMIKLLLHHGANPYQKNKYGIDSFYYATTKNNAAINNALEAYKR